MDNSGWVGRVVRSVQGRDSGRLYIVITIVDAEFVLVADGIVRQALNPKKKRNKHLKLVAIGGMLVTCELRTVVDKLFRGDKVFDFELARVLKVVNNSLKV